MTCKMTACIWDRMIFTKHFQKKIQTRERQIQVNTKWNRENCWKMMTTLGDSSEETNWKTGI